MDKGRLVVLACAAATLIGINGATFAQPFRSVASSKVSMAARTPGNQPTDEPDYPEFKPTGNYMLETPFFNMEKFKKEETLGLAAVFGAPRPPMQHGHRERPADPGSEGAALPMPTRKDTKSSKLSPPAESLCILCNGTEGKSVAPDFISMSPQESLSWSADTAESCRILTSLAESVRHAQKSMDFHCNRIVSLAGRDGDLAGHVLCASKGAAEVVSELCNAIAETLLDVKVYKGQLESMFKSIALGREQASENLDIQEETGVTFGENHDSEETLSNPEAFLPTYFVAKAFVDVAVEEAIEIDTSEEARKKEGYSRIRSLLRAGSKMSDLGRETVEGPFSWSVFFREMVKSPQFDLTFAVLIFLSSLVMALQVQYVALM